MSKIPPLPHNSRIQISSKEGRTTIILPEYFKTLEHYAILISFAVLLFISYLILEDAPILMYLKDPSSIPVGFLTILGIFIPLTILDILICFQCLRPFKPEQYTILDEGVLFQSGIYPPVSLPGISTLNLTHIHIHSFKGLFLIRPKKIHLSITDLQTLSLSEKEVVLRHDGNTPSKSFLSRKIKTYAQHSTITVAALFVDTDGKRIELGSKLDEEEKRWLLRALKAPFDLSDELFIE